MIRFSEHPNYTPEQVQQHLEDALAIVGRLELDDELRPLAFDKAVNLLSAKQITAEQLGGGMAIAGPVPRH